MGKLLILVTALTVLGAGSVLAQEGCRSVTLSCSQLQANCTKNCGHTANPAQCSASICAAAMPRCQESGIWGPRGAATCWKTSRRS